MSVHVRSVPVRLLALAFVAALVFVAASQARAADPALFDVGAATVNINPDPDKPQYIGGYGYKEGPTTAVNDDLEVRAFVVGSGEDAAAFVVADSTGWFAAYKGENLAPYGVDATREKIAEALNQQGYAIDRANVIISTTHVHAAPAIVGIWGTPDETYLKKISDASVKAASDAAVAARPSEIWTAVGDIRSFIWQNGQGTNHPDGFEYDNELPVMWARDPETGATNAVYASVPNHPDQFNGGANGMFSADWPGYARRALDELNGGTTVIGPGTLGRQEPPGSVNTYEEVIPQGKIVANAIQRTLAQATPITDATIAGSEQYMQTVADNDDLLFAMNLYNPPAGVCVDAFEICTIPRSTVPPYLDTSGEDPLIGTHVATVRIGDVVYATNPGEAFPEVNFAIRAGIEGARHVNTLGLSGDMLGYYYERDDYTEQQFGSSNFETYNVGPELPSANVTAALEGAEEIGFGTTPQVVHAPFNADIEDRPGLQWYPDRLESADPTVNILGSSAKSQDETVPAPLEIEWDFDDGTTDTTVNQERFDHTFPGPGTYDVVATVTGSNSKTRSWEETITINPELQSSASLTSRAWNGARLEAGASGGSGVIVSAHWTCQDGTEVSGLRVLCDSTRAGTATVTVVDGAGNTDEASVPVGKAPPKPAARLKLVKAKVKPKRVKRGRGATLAIVVKNTGSAAAAGVTVCVKAPGKAKRGVKIKPACRKKQRLAAGKTLTVKPKVRTFPRTKPKLGLRVQVRAKGVGNVGRTVVLRTRR